MPHPLSLVFPSLWCWSGWELKYQEKDDCHLTLLPYPTFCAAAWVLAPRQAISAATRLLWRPLHGQFVSPWSVLLKMTASEKELRSFTLLACAGVAASPDPSVMMIQFVKLQDDSCIMCLGRLGFCWFSEQNQVSEVRPAKIVTADTRKRADLWNCPFGCSDPLQLCHWTTSLLHSKFISGEKGYLIRWISLLSL